MVAILVLSLLVVCSAVQASTNWGTKQPRDWDLIYNSKVYGSGANGSLEFCETFREACIELVGPLNFHHQLECTVNSTTDDVWTICGGKLKVNDDEWGSGQTYDFTQQLLSERGLDASIKAWPAAPLPLYSPSVRQAIRVYSSEVASSLISVGTAGNIQHGPKQTSQPYEATIVASASASNSRVGHNSINRSIVQGGSGSASHLGKSRSDLTSSSTADSSSASETDSSDSDDGETTTNGGKKTPTGLPSSGGESVSDAIASARISVAAILGSVVLTIYL